MAGKQHGDCQAAYPAEVNAMSSDSLFFELNATKRDPGKKKWEFERDRCALLVIDMQNGFVSEGGSLRVPEAGRRIPAIKKLIDKCRELGVPIIYTLQRSDAVLCPLEVSNWPDPNADGLREGTWGTEVVPELTPLPGDMLLWKRRFSAFFQTDLELILRNIRGSEKPVDTVIICGTVTNICCESTARDAFFRDFKVVFGSDVTAAIFEDAHIASLRNMEIFGRVLDCDTIITALEHGKG